MSGHSFYLSFPCTDDACENPEDAGTRYEMHSGRQHRLHGSPWVWGARQHLA